jgi:benzoylformate decarboxylase
VQIARPAVKWAQEVAHADQLPVLVRRAFHDASAAPAGPVFLSLPMDVMEEMSAVGIAEPSVIDRRMVAGSLDALAARLAAITPGRLLIIAGDEVYASDAAAEVTALAEALGAPVYGSSWPSCLPFPTAHPLWAGNMPSVGKEIYDTLGHFVDHDFIQCRADHSRRLSGLSTLRGCPRSRPNLYDAIIGRRGHQGIAASHATAADGGDRGEGG